MCRLDPCSPENFQNYTLVPASVGPDPVSVRRALIYYANATKVDCCRACQISNCLGWLLQTTYNYDYDNDRGAYYSFSNNYCYGDIQDESGPSDKQLSKPWPDNCPYGGYPVGYSYADPAQAALQEECQQCSTDACIYEKCFFLDPQTSQYDYRRWYDAEMGPYNVNT
jgi:hypothetical protein